MRDSLRVRLRKRFFPKVTRVRTPTVLQMEAVECGAAALGIILAYYKRIVPLEELRIVCGVSRDGSKASNVVKAARTYGLAAKGMRLDLSELRNQKLPFVVFWNFNHFLVVEGFGEDCVYLNDPGAGPRKATLQEFDKAYTGVALIFEPGPDFQPGGERRSLYQTLRPRLAGAETALGFLVLVSLALVIPGLVIPVFTQVFVDNYLIARMDDWVKPLLLGMAVTAVLRSTLTWLQQMYLLRMEMRLSLVGSGTFFWHVLQLPIEFFHQRYAADLSQRVASNDTIARLLSGGLATNAVNVVALIFYVAIMIQYDWSLTLFGIVMTSINLFALSAISRLRTDGNMRMLQDRGKLMATTMGGIQTIETIKATGAETDFFMRWSGFKAKVSNTEAQLNYYTRLLSALPTLLSTLTTAAILGLGGFRVISGEMTVGMLVAFQSLMASFTQPITNLMGLASQFQEAKGDLARLDDVLRYPAEEGLAKAPPARSGSAAGKLQGHLELRDVSFGYSRLDPPLIENFNLRLAPGQRVALVGKSASGKSTVSRLVMGLIKPWTGEITFDGVARERLPREVLNASLGSVDQDVYLFEGTVRDNLTLWDETIPESDVTRAARDACIHDTIVSRPGGYGGDVGEGGANFSGGQKQRLEIARALAANPRVLVLDEATAALDPVTEKAIDDNIRRRGCTCLIVAHRLSAIRDCDEIILMDNGKIVERGSHDQLLAQNGAYSRLIGAEQP